MKPLKANLAKVRAGQSLWLCRGDVFTKVRVTARGITKCGNTKFSYFVMVELPERAVNGYCNWLSVVFSIPDEYRHKPLDWISKQADVHDFYNRIPLEFKCQHKNGYVSYFLVSHHHLHNLSVGGKPITEADVKQGLSLPVPV